MPRGILASTWLLAFAMYAPMFSVPPIAHILKEELLLTHMQTSLLFTAPILMIVALAIPAGIISDRIGVKKATGIGVILLAVGAMLRGTADSASTLLIFTFIYGAGLGWCYPNLAKLISGWVPPQRAGMAMGILSTHRDIDWCRVSLSHHHVDDLSHNQHFPRCLFHMGHCTYRGGYCVVDSG